MPNWGEILNEVNRSAAQRAPLGPDVDGIRQKYIKRLQEQAGRAVIVYASGWLKGGGDEVAYSVEGNDVHALMEVCHRVPEPELDLGSVKRQVPSHPSWSSGPVRIRPDVREKEKAGRKREVIP